MGLKKNDKRVLVCGKLCFNSKRILSDKEAPRPTEKKKLFFKWRKIFLKGLNAKVRIKYAGIKKSPKANSNSITNPKSSPFNNKKTGSFLFFILLSRRRKFIPLNRAKIGIVIILLPTKREVKLK